MQFRNRRDAGEQLGRALAVYAGAPGSIVLGLPRGGVPVAYSVAQALAAPLDIFLVRKLGVPGQEELAMGAIASGGVRVLNHEVIADIGIRPTEVERVTAREEVELARREELYRGERPFPNLRGKTVFLIDDGLATGMTMLAAIVALQESEPQRIVVGVPVGAAETCARIGERVDEVLCLWTPPRFYGVGAWYDDFCWTMARAR